MGFNNWSNRATCFTSGFVFGHQGVICSVLSRCHQSRWHSATTGKPSDGINECIVALRPSSSRQVSTISATAPRVRHLPLSESDASKVVISCRKNTKWFFENGLWVVSVLSCMVTGKFCKATRNSFLFFSSFMKGRKIRFWLCRPVNAPMGLRSIASRDSFLKAVDRNVSGFPIGQVRARNRRVVASASLHCGWWRKRRKLDWR